MMSDEPPAPTEGQGRRRSYLRWRILVPVVTAAGGLMFAVSFLASQGSDLRSDRDLTQLILERNDRMAGKALALDQLQREVNALSKGSAPDDARIGVLSKKAESLAPAAAATKISGPGVSVSLSDAKLDSGKIPEGFNADDVVVHQQDVQAVVNALWSAGAEGMMIQDQRIISTSAVRCVGNTLILQGRVYSPPYVITAVGDVKKLERALDSDPVIDIYKDYVNAVGLGYDVQQHASVELPAYSGSLDMQYATPLAR